jgi:hypothetical protein
MISAGRPGYDACEGPAYMIGCRPDVLVGRLYRKVFEGGIISDDSEPWNKSFQSLEIRVYSRPS